MEWANGWGLSQKSFHMESMEWDMDSMDSIWIIPGRIKTSPPLPPSAIDPPPEPTLEEYNEQVRALGDFIDDQAEEMPEDYESQPEQEEEESDEDDSMSG